MSAEFLDRSDTLMYLTRPDIRMSRVESRQHIRVLSITKRRRSYNEA